ncbi:MAG: glutamine-hydrolyzing GMP synthase [Candidatus Aminicenantes bacterium]|nr:glutamine-hydrolyzing GMP synthase [Candidatus Aminicenantes bacterium]
MEVKSFINDQIDMIRKIVGETGALSALSGGVDSSTCTLLAWKALGPRLKVVFIDDGLMREGEPEQVKSVFAELGIPVEIVNAQNEFFQALNGLVDPEEKRKAFREVFYRTLGRIIQERGVRFLIQGTIAADIIETRDGIKTQHNILEQIGIDPEISFGFKIIEPLKTLFKHEVREVAKALGLPESILKRMPFPGPGLAARILGEITPERVAIVRRATKIVEEEVSSFQPFQAFAVLLTDKATGIEKGQRKLGDIIIIRSVESRDAMTAEPSPLPWAVLMKITERIIEEIPSVTRVAYELTPKPPATIEYI